jgi:hypothetical protein
MDMPLLPSLTRRCVVAFALIAAPCSAQEDDIGPFHWPHAPAFGSGVYLLDDGTETQSYRGNFSVSLRDTTEDTPGVRLLLAGALGVENLDDNAGPLERGADDVEHVGFLPGVELEHALGERWDLRTRVQLGYAKELEGTEHSALLAAIGLRGRVRFDDAPGKPSLITGILWSGYESSIDERHPMLRVTAGLEFDVRAARWRFRDSPMSWRPHVLKDWYYHRPPPLPDSGGVIENAGDEIVRADDEWQIGVAAAREDGFKILFFKFDAVGVAYRFARHGEGLRFYLNSVF